MSTDDGTIELSFMKAKVELLRQKMQHSVSLSYQLLPLQPQLYRQEAEKILKALGNIDPQEKQLAQYDEIILGKIEGQLTSCDFEKLLEPVVGKVSTEKLKNYLKQKSEQRNYGKNSKDKNCCIRQVKKLQCLKKYFDIQQIAKKRKHNLLYRNFVKSLNKFFQLYEKVDEKDVVSIKNAYEQYNNFNKQESRYLSFVKKLQGPKNLVQKEPSKEQEAQLEKNKEQKPFQGAMSKQIEQQKKDDNNSSQKKNQEKKTPKKTTKVNKKSKKSDQKTAKQPEKEEEKRDQQGVNQSAKKPNKQKTVKKSNNMSITDFFKKPTSTPLKRIDNSVLEGNDAHEVSQLPPKEEKVQELKQKKFWKNIVSSQQASISLNELRTEMKSNRMQNEQFPSNPYFVNVIMTLSTIQYFDYPMKQTVNIDFSQPFTKIQEVLYFEDESEEFQGESANAEDEQEEQEEQESGGNNTIVNDSYLSEEEISSFQSNEVNIKVEYGKGQRWIFDSLHNKDPASIELIDSFTMIRLDQGDNPLQMDIEEEKFEFVMTVQIWRDVYSVVHGYFGVKQQLIKQVLNILPSGVSKTWVDSMIKERTQKINNQRLIKPYFIEELKQKLEDIEEVLIKVKEGRDIQIKRIKAEKNQQKDLKLEKDILECTGSRYIVNLLKQLKEKGYKQLRRTQLIEFINERTGQQWEAIKAQMHTMSRPITQMMKPNPMEGQCQNQQNRILNQGGQIIEEVVVEDQQFQKIQKQDVKKQAVKQKQEDQYQVKSGKRKRRTTKKILEFQSLNEARKEKRKPIAKKTSRRQKKTTETQEPHNLEGQKIAGPIITEEKSLKDQPMNQERLEDIQKESDQEVRKEENIIPGQQLSVQRELSEKQPEKNVKENSEKEKSSDKAQELTVEKAHQNDEDLQENQNGGKACSAPLLANVDSM